MKAAKIYAANEHGDVRLETDVPVPTPGPNEILVQVAACGMCGHDQSDRLGLTRLPLPNILGHEISGTIVALGSKVQGFKEGDRVACKQQTFCGYCPACKSGRGMQACEQRGFNHGGWGEFVALSAGCVYPIPDNIDLEEASIIACAVGTTFNALSTVAKVLPGETVLTTGAGGGLGIHGMQVAKALGARSIALTSSPQKVEMLKNIGADDVVLAEGNDYWDAILEKTGGKGPDVVLDNVGLPNVFTPCFRAMKTGGRYVFTGQVGRQKIDIYAAFIFAKRGIITGSGPGTMTEFADAMKLVEEGKVKPIIEKMKLDDVVEATLRQDANKGFGRLVLIP